MKSFVLIDQTGTIEVADLYRLSNTTDRYIALVADWWERRAWSCRIATQLADVDKDQEFPIVLLRDPEHAGYLGYHATTPDGRPYARVFTAPILADVGPANFLYGPGGLAMTIAHEEAEGFVDLPASLYADNGEDLDAYEACDACEGDEGAVIDGVNVSNFLAPRWFDVGSTGGPFDFLRKIERPFAMTPGGYRIRLRDAGSYAVYGERSKRAGLTHEASRSFKRGIEEHRCKRGITDWTP